MISVATALKIHGHTCYICGYQVEINHRTHSVLRANRDHKIPTCKGGTNGPENIFPVHFICNMVKHENLLDETIIRASKTVVEIFFNKPKIYRTKNGIWVKLLRGVHHQYHSWESAIKSIK